MCHRFSETVYSRRRLALFLLLTLLPIDPLPHAPTSILVHILFTIFTTPASHRLLLFLLFRRLPSPSTYLPYPMLLSHYPASPRASFSPPHPSGSGFGLLFSGGVRGAGGGSGKLLLWAELWLHGLLVHLVPLLRCHRLQRTHLRATFRGALHA